MSQSIGCFRLWSILEHVTNNMNKSCLLTGSSVQALDSAIHRVNHYPADKY